MDVVSAGSNALHHTPAWWQRALVADGQAWVWIGTLVISLILITVLALRYFYSLWCFRRIRLLRGQGLIDCSQLRPGQCAYLQRLDGTEQQRLRRWRTMVRRVQSNTIEVDLPVPLEDGEPFAPGTRVALGVNAIDSLYVMETTVERVAAGEMGALHLRRQPLLHRLQRRQFARVEVLVPAVVEVVGGKSIGRYAGVILDIGGGGVCVQAPVAPAVGSIVRLEVSAWSDILPDCLRLTVVGVSEAMVDGHLEYRLHCAFTNLNAEQLERVARFVHRRLSELTTEQRWHAPQGIGTQPSS